MIAFHAVAFGENVARNKPVTLIGGFGVPIEDVYGHGVLAPASSITDGTFTDEGHYWSDNTVWWEATDPSAISINIDLQGSKTITGFLVQADDNDQYVLSGDSGYICTVDFAWGFGMTTRRIVLGSAVITSHLKLVALAVSAPGSDSSYACSEIQAFDGAVPYNPTPEPASFAALGVGVLGFLVRTRKRVC